jgi:hypothetical protein
MLIKRGATIGAIVGAGVAIGLLSLEHVRPFSPHVDSVVERLTFRLCPLYILGFANGMGSMAVLVIVTILGNALLYGVALGMVTALATLFQSKGGMT